MVGGTGTQELVDSQTRTGAILQQPDLRDEQCGGEEGLQRGSHSFSPGARRTQRLGKPAGLRAAGARSWCWASPPPALSAWLTQRSPTAS